MHAFKALLLCLFSLIWLTNGYIALQRLIRVDIRGGQIEKYGAKQSRSSLFSIVEIAEFGDSDEQLNDDKEPKKAKTNGYEGNFKVGDIVKVKKSIRMWHVKQYSQKGFDCLGFVGRVENLLLYGKKHGTLCSAITPIKVEFLPENDGIPPGMFAKKFVGHFCAEELDLVKAAEIDQPSQA